jgi:nucleotide sugar dehydrogenase
MPHYPGCGVVGHCIPVDPYYLINRAKEANFEHSFLAMARSVNNAMPSYTVERLIWGLNKIGRSLKATKIGLMGLSYKANVGDLRESPALVIRKILEEKYEVKLNIYDPYFLDQSTHSDVLSFLQDCEAVVLTVNHREFVQLPAETWADLKVVIDGRNCLKPEQFNSESQVYLGVGR